MTLLDLKSLKMHNIFAKYLSMLDRKMETLYKYLGFVLFCFVCFCFIFMFCLFFCLLASNSFESTLGQKTQPPQKNANKYKMHAYVLWSRDNKERKKKEKNKVTSKNKNKNKNKTNTKFYPIFKIPKTWRLGIWNVCLGMFSFICFFLFF